MSVFRPRAPETGGGGLQPPDPRLTPTPDYGTLGPDSDLAKSNAGVPVALGPTAPSVGRVSDLSRRSGGNARALQILAMIGGMVAALLVSSGGGAGAVLQKIAGVFSAKKISHSTTKVSASELERQKPQKQAETLLARAVGRNDGATDQIQANVDSWRGKIKWNPQISQLTTVALNSKDLRVRASGIEVQLAAYGLAKDASTVDRLILQADSSDRAQRIWALWSLGLLGNRGVESDRVVQVLTAHLTGSKKDSDPDSRHWAVEGLALVGTTETIAPLLDAMHNDPSAIVRERAACSLAESGMLTHERRMTAVPQLIDYSDDAALDAQTHAWAFQALHDITKQRLPNDSGAWREWYQKSVVSGQ
jgi:HEAT repeats